jgi:regulator of replication initiation timing
MSERTLKEEALLQRVGELTVSYEERVADLRVQLTQVVNENEELRREVEGLRQNPEQPPMTEVVEGEVVGGP